MFQSMVEPYTGVKRCLWKRILHQITFASRSASSLLQVISFFWQAKTQFLQDYFNQQQFQSVDITICVFLINIIIYIYATYIYIYMLHTHAYIYICSVPIFGGPNIVIFCLTNQLRSVGLGLKEFLFRVLVDLMKCGLQHRESNWYLTWFNGI